MPSGFKMAEAKWPAIERAFKDDFPVVIPLGAGCKEHGYHLPMNTDMIIAEYLAHWVMHNYPVLIAPTVTQSFFPAFEEYPGSSTLSYETSVSSIVEMCTTWHKQGAKQFYIINTGISTNRVLAAARDILKDKGVTLHYFDFSALDSHPEIKKITQQKVGTHADEIETSIMLCIKPEVVDLSLAVPEESPDKPGPLTRDVSSTDKTISVTGAWGNPTLAALEKGEVAVKVLKQMLQQDLSQLTFPDEKIYGANLFTFSKN